ncbi:hypothetical protein HG530_011210 [Fusarium avenaceum]|nr:hypothetical protein HG530_011210 [Fusarium avenaceum]
MASDHSRSSISSSSSWSEGVNIHCELSRRLMGVAGAHPADSHTLDDSVALTDLFQCALAAILEDNVCDSNLTRRHVISSTAGVPAPCLHALGPHLSKQLHEDATGISSFAGVHINEDNSSTKQSRVNVTSRGVTGAGVEGAEGTSTIVAGMLFLPLPGEYEITLALLVGPAGRLGATRDALKLRFFKGEGEESSAGFKGTFVVVLKVFMTGRTGVTGPIEEGTSFSSPYSWLASERVSSKASVLTMSSRISGSINDISLASLANSTSSSVTSMSSKVGSSISAVLSACKSSMPARTVISSSK